MKQAVKGRSGKWRIGTLALSTLVPATLAGGFVTAGESSASSPQTQPAPGNSIEADGTVNVAPFELPPSLYLSEAAKAALPRKPSDPEVMLDQALAAGNAEEIRARIGEFTAPQIKHLTQLYPVRMQDTTLAGVPAVIVKPAAGIPAANKSKVLLELPGGGFVMGAAHGTGMVESIPLAVLDKVEIVSITYRQGPEFKYPAATEDVTAVYRELLKTHKPQDIAVFGCSAGGRLTAESMAWFQKERLPLPGAIGIFCASADSRRGSGDSSYFSRPFQGLPSLTRERDYFKGVDLNDPLVSPILSAEYLKHFPPTLLITATRAQEMSSAVDTHRQLVKAGVDAEIHLWDGLGHAFFYNIDLPEAREAFDVMANFFGRHLHLSK
jgi:epsilon-lactone hydrolase